MFELGTFAVFNMLGVGLLASGQIKHVPVVAIFPLIAMVVFFYLAFTMMTVEDIGQIITYDDGTTTWTETRVFIADADSFYLIYVYFGMALMALLSFMFSRKVFG